MKNIELVKNKYIKVFAKKYYNKDIENLSRKNFYRCSLIAEIWAYIYHVIPEGYRKYSIFDFDGRYIDKHNSSKNNVIPVDIVLKVKDKICKYCWDKKWDHIKNDKDMSFLRSKSVMLDRYDNGNNIVIYGTSDRPIGRTMIASIIMKEAIKLRAIRNARGQTYDWVDFPILFDTICKDDMELSNYASCDWLVVDNVIKKFRSHKQTTLMIDKIDPFFINRFKNKRATILVFKFDIRDSSLDIENMFGTGISKIINSNRSIRIPLCDNFNGEING
jgi:hypothetical protein